MHTIDQCRWRKCFLQPTVFPIYLIFSRVSVLEILHKIDLLFHFQKNERTSHRLQERFCRHDLHPHQQHNQLCHWRKECINFAFLNKPIASVNRSFAQLNLIKGCVTVFRSKQALIWLGAIRIYDFYHLHHHYKANSKFIHRYIFIDCLFCLINYFKLLKFIVFEISLCSR